ncbi:hypothetical protein H6771_00210 [Candidatus Peribacteria bacterium]|nr:hypothetical protein [Candidatus Peribacteria bacterium]
MNYARIIAAAWELTKQTPKLTRLIFIPAFVSVVAYTARIGWQVWMYASEFGFLGARFSYSMIGDFFSLLVEKSLVLWFVNLLIVVILFTFILPSWVNSTLYLGVQEKLETGKEGNLRKHLIDASAHFWPLFRMHAVLAPFAFMSILLWSLTLFRFVHTMVNPQLLLTIILVYLLLCLIVMLFCIFSPLFIVYRNMDVRESISASIRLVWIRFEQVAAMLLLMLLVHLRIFLNAAVVFALPVLLVVYVGPAAQGLVLAIALVLGLILIGMVAWVTALVEVFQANVWMLLWRRLMVLESLN